jgi:outer membrane receptor protein involved in Fe transport
LSFIILTPSPGIAGVTGKIAGKVIDQDSGEPMAGVQIMIKGTNHGATTDLEGFYVLLNIQPGNHSLVFVMMGYEQQEIRDVAVSADYTTTINASMRETIIDGEVIVVTAEKPLIQKDLTSTAVAIPESRISELPVEEMEQLIILQAGVTVDPKGNIHMRGGRSTEIAYLIDGVPVTDEFDRTQAVKVENTGIQELQVISGTFNAEYGQAQSGIVNIITKKGSNHFLGELSIYGGDYLSSHDDLFYNINSLNPLSEQNIIGRISGPIPEIGTFFLTARKSRSDGWLYGQREYSLPEILDRIEGYTLYNSTSHPGDSTYVSMNDFNRFSMQGNVSLSLLKKLPIDYSFFYNDENSQYYDHRYAKLPDGDSRSYQYSRSHFFNVNWLLSPVSFFSFNFTQFEKTTERKLFDQPNDERFLFPAISTEQIYQRNLLEGLEHVTTQTNNEYYYIQNMTQIFKMDFTSQLHPIHLLKAGIEFKTYELAYEYYEVINKPDNKIENLFIPYVDQDDTPRHDNYDNNPVYGAFYIQDKIEFNEIVVNAGLRYDYFDSRGTFPSIPDQKENNRLTAPHQEADPKMYLSPRFGLAFPISEEGVIHFSYGHFTQIPDFKSLFWNTEYEIRLGALSTMVGNPDLKPERTVSWEVGIQQQITRNMAISGTFYFKDITNLLGQEIIRLKGGQAYARYINRDYGNVKGIVIAIEKRPASLFAFNLDYTYQIASGNASDPYAVFTDNQGTPPRESEKQVLPLDWDQRHTINASFTFKKQNKWGVSFILQAGSGLPYTPTDPDRSLRIAFENSSRKPPTFNVDMMAHYDFSFFGFRPSLFLKVYNLFDYKNEIDVFTDTGRANFTHTLNYQLGDRRPDFYGKPRLVLFGLKMSFQTGGKNTTNE